MNNIEALQRALDALGPTAPECCGCATEWEIAINAIRQVIEQAQQAEPVACDCDSPAWCKQYKKCNRTMLGLMPYVSPPPRQPLTDEEIALIDWESLATKKDCVRAIESKLKEKNT